MGHDHYILTRLIINITVGEDCVEVLNALLCRPIVIIFQALLDRAEVHRVFYYLVVVRNIQFHCIDRRLEWPTELMLPHGLHHNRLQIMQLICVTS